MFLAGKINLMPKINSKILLTLLAVFLTAALYGQASAQSSSSNYKVNEYLFGSGGELQLNGTAYSARAAAGELGVGNISSPHFQANAGFNTTDEPVLEVTVNGGTIDLGILSKTGVAAGYKTFSVRNYLSSGYVVQILGTPPKNNSGGHALSNMSSPTSSSPGTEQFGINLTANSLTGPGAFGADPQQQPDTTFGFGTAASDYATTNVFKYVEGDTIASSAKSSCTTLYTISAIANISTTTPGGRYGTSLFVNVIPTF